MARNPTTLEVEVIDTPKLMADMLTLARETGAVDEGVVRLELYGERHGFILKDGKSYYVDSEGVAYTTDSDEVPVKVGLYPRGEDTFSLVPSLEMELMYSDLKKHGYLGERVNLADFVRTFGDRLEGNYATLVRHFEGRS